MERRHKLFFWIILGMLSTFFAEVVSGSYIFPFFTAWGILVVVPLYMLHILVLSHVAFNYGKPVFYVLLLLGVVFGLYEGYITKVLWVPWGTPSIFIGGVAAVETIVLILWWHPFMSFIIPLIFAEAMLTKSSDILRGLPKWVNVLLGGRNRFYLFFILLALASGTFHGINAPSIESSLLSFFSTSMLMALFIYFWNKKIGGKYTMKELLPGRHEFKILLSILIAFYIITGIVINPQNLPSLQHQATVWAIYLIVFALLYLGLKKSKADKMSAKSMITVRPSLKIFMLTVALFAISSAAFKIFQLMWIFWTIWASGIIFGIVIFIYTVIAVLRRKRQQI